MAKLHDLPGVPSALDLVDDAQNRQVMELILIRQEAGRPFAAPPGTPADRLAALGHAFDETLTDPDFIAEAAKAQMEIEPMTGAAIANNAGKGLRRTERHRRTRRRAGLSCGGALTG